MKPPLKRPPSEYWASIPGGRRRVRSYLPLLLICLVLLVFLFLSYRSH